MEGSWAAATAATDAKAELGGSKGSTGGQGKEGGDAGALKEAGCLASCGGAARLNLHRCTLWLLAGQHGMQTDTVLRENLVMVSTLSKANLISCELLAEPSPTGSVVTGVGASMGSNITIEKSLLQGCCIALFTQSHLTATDMVVRGQGHMRRRARGAGGPAAGCGGAAQGSSGSSSSSSGPSPVRLAHMRTVGLLGHDFHSAELSHCHIQGFDAAVEVRKDGAGWVRSEKHMHAPVNAAARLLCLRSLFVSRAANKVALRHATWRKESSANLYSTTCTTCMETHPWWLAGALQ